MNTSSSIDRDRLLVTGSSGFVGRHFCLRYGGAGLVDEAGRVDLRDAERVYAAIAARPPQAVLHLAAQSSVASSFNDPAGTQAANFQGTLNLLQALKAVQFTGVFLYVSSAEVYGSVEEAELPLREDRPLRPRSPYAVSKVAAEALCYQWSQTEDFRVVVARPFNQIGTGQDQRFAIPDFAHQIIAMRDGLRPAILTTGNLDMTRDFSDILDTIDAYQSLLEAGKNGEIYNVCSGVERSLRSLVEEMLHIAGVTAEFRIDQARLRSVEQRRMAGDPTRIYEQLGWKCTRDFTHTLANILKEAETN